VLLCSANESSKLILLLAVSCLCWQVTIRKNRAVSTKHKKKAFLVFFIFILLPP
jgi:hypothetical protein